jgi:hypothetical protein
VLFSVIQMLRHGVGNDVGEIPIWPAEFARVTRCDEADLREVVLRLRMNHWRYESTAMKDILTRYHAHGTSDTHYGLSDTFALSLSQLRFDAPLLPGDAAQLTALLRDYSTVSASVKAAAVLAAKTAEECTNNMPVFTIPEDVGMKQS